MFDIGWSEMLVVAIVAVIVIGPKDLPKMLHSMGKWVGKARALAREFQSSLEDIAREAELDQVRKQVGQIGSDIESEASGLEKEIRDSTEGADNSPAAIAGEAESGAGSEEAIAKAEKSFAERYAEASGPAHSLGDRDAGAEAKTPDAAGKTRSSTGT